MSEMEKQEIIDRVKSMEIEEQKLVLKGITDDVLLLDEIKRRMVAEKEMIQDAREVLRVSINA